jgi:hypothetical protein
MARDFMSTQTGGEGETIQAAPTTPVDAQQFNVDIPVQQQEQPQAQQEQQQQAPVSQEIQSAEVQQVNPYEELGLQDAGVELPEYATEQEIEINKPTNEVVTDVVELPDSQNTFESETIDGEVIINPSIPNPADQPALNANDKFEYQEDNAGTTIDGEVIIDPSIINMQDEKKAIDQEYKDTPIEIKNNRVLFNKPDDGDKPKKPKKDGIYKLSWQPEAIFKKEGDAWYKSLDEGKNYFKIEKGDVKKRYAVLENQAEMADSKALAGVASVVKPAFGNVKGKVSDSDVTMGGNQTVSKNITYRDLTKPKIGTEIDRYNKDGTVNFNYNPDVAEASDAAQVLIKKSEEGRGDGYYTFPDRDDAIFKKEKGEWYVDITKTGKEFKPLTGENIPARERVLEARAIPRIESLVNLTTTPSIKSVVKSLETGKPALVIENQNAVQALNANAKWDKIAEVDQKATALKSSFDDALNFVDTEIYDQVKDKLTNDQKDNLVNLQKDIKEIIGDGEYTDIKAKKVAELLKSGEQFFNDSMKVNEVVNEAYSAGVSIDRLNFEKKQKSFEQDYDLKASTESDRIGAEMFKSLSNMTNFILENADAGKINIDKNTGAYSFTDRVSLRERQYIESKLNGYLEEYENIQSQRYSEVREEIEGNRNQKKVTESNIVRLKDQLNSAEVKSNPDLYRKTQQMLETEKNKLSYLDKLIDDKQLSSNTVFLTEPKKVVQSVAGTITESAKSSFKSVPKGLGPKQKFDLFYQNLQEKNKQLAIDNDINYSGLDLVAMRTKDILDWKGFYSLNNAEKEYLKNKATLNSLKSLYYNNDNGFTSDSAGFWESFTNGFSNMLMPTMSAADGYQLETEKSQIIGKTLKEQGFNTNDFATPETLKKIQDRQTVDFWSKESFGKMTGTSVAFMGILIATSELPGAALKSLATAEKLITGAKDIAQVTKLANGIQNTYNEVLGLTKFGRFLKPAINEGINFEIGGTVVQSAKDELDFVNGLVGGVFGEAFSAALGKMEKTQMINYVQAIFGDKTNVVVNTLKKTGRLASRGIGETAQETGEELGSIYSQSKNFRELMENANKSFGTFDKVQEFVIASFILGTAFGVVQGNKAKDVYENLPEGKRRQVDDLLSSLQSDINTAHNATEEYADDKLEEQENKKKAEGNDKENEQRVPGEKREGEKPQQTESITETSQEEVSPSGVVQEEQTVEGLRAQEQAELTNAIPNIEDYKVEGEIDKSLMTPEDLAKYNEIYTKYDELITPLLETTETTEAPNIGVTTEETVVEETPKTAEQISVDIESAIADNPGVMDKIKATLGSLLDFDKGPKRGRTTKIGKKVKQELESSTIADLYLQAKEDGSNPALVNEIEKIIMPKTELSVDVEEIQNQSELNAFDELSSIDEISNQSDRKAAIAAFDEKHGGQYKRMSKIHSNFASIARNLIKSELLLKDC